MVEITLDDVSSRAGVTVKTVLRHFGSRDGLLEAMETFARVQIAEERHSPPGDVDEAVRALFDHYELRGDAVIRMLGQELWDNRFRSDMDEGRRMHRQLIEAAFAPQLQSRDADREALLDLLVVATDVYTWKLLRRDRGLGRAVAEDRVRRMVDALLAASGEGR